MQSPKLISFHGILWSCMTSGNLCRKISFFMSPRTLFIVSVRVTLKEVFWVFITDCRAIIPSITKWREQNTHGILWIFRLPKFPGHVWGIFEMSSKELLDHQTKYPAREKCPAKEPIFIGHSQLKNVKREPEMSCKEPQVRLLLQCL